MLAGCNGSDLPDGARITLPAPPTELAACFARAFPDIPQRVLTKSDVVRIIGEAKLLDRAKTACGDRGVAWIEDVVSSYARHDASP